MPRIMKTLNDISRCQALFRNESAARGRAYGLTPCQHTFVLALCRAPGRTQDELARDICLNKSTVARTLAELERGGFVKREVSKSDKRCMLVYPTEKMLVVHKEVAEVADLWNSAILDGIAEKEVELVRSVLIRMNKNARAAVGIEVAEK